MKLIFYNSSQVAELLSLSVEYVRKLATAKKLESIKPFGNRLLFPVEQFEKMKQKINNSKLNSHEN